MKSEIKDILEGKKTAKQVVERISGNLQEDNLSSIKSKVETLKKALSSQVESIEDVINQIEQVIKPAGIKISDMDLSAYGSALKPELEVFVKFDKSFSKLGADEGEALMDKIGKLVSPKGSVSIQSAVIRSYFNY